MSSNIQIKRICQYCGKEFIAKTTKTAYCSHRCNSLAYKEKIRADKIKQSHNETSQIRVSKDIRPGKTKSIENLKDREYLTVKEVSMLINCSRQNVYKLIKSGKLKATNLLIKKTLVRRSDIDKLFSNDSGIELIPQQQKIDLQKWEQAGFYKITDCYTLAEIKNKYGISESAIYSIIRRENIPTIKKGWYVYVPKSLIDDIFN
ncbi:MAG: helix-turn-helix domain-containing protein [Bacteroidales bacterium]|nr:helix-turn-helix domain-containing protein [Bacteroidales bacterium]